MACAPNKPGLVTWVNKPTKEAILIVKAENRHYPMCQHWDEDKETSDFPKSSFRGLNSRRQEAHGSPARNNVTRVKRLQKLLGPLILPLTSPL